MHLPRKYKFWFLATNGLSVAGFWCTDGKQEFIGDIDYDESLNYLFLPRNFLLELLIRILICRTSSQYRVLFTTIHQPPPRMMRTEYTVWTLVYFDFWRSYTTTDHVLEDDEEDIKVKVEQQNFFLSNIRISRIK